MSLSSFGLNTTFVPVNGFLPTRHALPQRKTRRPSAVQAVQKAPPVRRASPTSRPDATSAPLIARLVGRSSVAPKRKGELVVEGDFMQSTWRQRLKTYGFFALAAAEAAKISLSVHDTSSALSVCVALTAGYLFADLGTGVYHWAVDNYGSAATPVVGRQIAAFQGHHAAPWTITQRQFANNLSALTEPTAPQLVLLLLVPGVPASAAAFAVSALTFMVLSQELHRQAHMARPAPIVAALQRAGLALPRAMHARHHAKPHDTNYCIVSGIWNKPLDDARIFRRLEAIVFRLTGNEPITWRLDPALKEEALSL